MQELMTQSVDTKKKKINQDFKKIQGGRCSIYGIKQSQAASTDLNNHRSNERKSGKFKELYFKINTNTN